MIKRLKKKFIILSILSIFVLLTVMVAGINTLNYISVVREADDTLKQFSQNDFGIHGFDGAAGVAGRPPSDLPPKILRESRYFSVVVNRSGEIINMKTDQLILIDEDRIAEYVQSAVKESKNKGFIGDYRYLKTETGDNTRITFLDCGRKLNAYKVFLIISIIMALAGFIVVIFVISFFAGRFIRPIAESYEKQKRFITDAGHELKTPLTIINANVDILEMDLGSNESLKDIKQQTKRLTKLTNDLVYLAHMEESENSLQMIDFPVSEVVRETSKPFKILAKTQGKDFSCNVQPMLTMHGNNMAIKQLVSILLDNAFKYSPSDSLISLDFVQQNRSLVLTVLNYTESNITQKDLQQVFERFYRTDSSRNSETGGHGIGLSVAKAIVTAHGGKINAYTNGGNSFKIVAAFPV